MTRRNDPSNDATPGAGPASGKKPLTVPCPQCQKPIAWTTENLYRPFCSKRCKLLDLGAWADGSHRIAGEPHMDETELDELIDRLERGQD
ncbi:DNA gyrase inhibitor YacG [Salinicola halimionae]|uniref:DNA gyrase inhibitor YacG n=1 Tax=Salinicola halimionae TaxID=1949081 RepID=UPI000DA17B94|nr:DNA gyrase inhibitor YacG [Salinicola halimionae]